MWNSLSLLLVLSPFTASIQETAAEVATPSKQTTADWPHWRGPDRNGVSPETGWSSVGLDKPLWTAEVGRGYSSPSVANGRLYTRGFFEEDGVDVTVCLDANTGKELWSHTAEGKLWDNMHGGGTLSTPIVDVTEEGDFVYMLSRFGILTALNGEDGEVLWERSMLEDFEVETGFFGLASSPVVWGDEVIVNVGRTVSLNKKTGKETWATRDYGYSYATPEPFLLEGEELLAIFNAEGLVILERSAGEELAKHEWTSGYNVNSASPIVIDNRFFISTGYDDKGCTMLELTPEGFEPVWASKRMNSKMNGCVLVDDLLYGFDDAVLRCLDLEGEVQWSERGLGKGTVIASDGRLIVLSEEGELLIAPATAEGFSAGAPTKVFEQGVCWTTPVLAGGRLYLRNSEGSLVCRDHRPQQ